MLDNFDLGRYRSILCLNGTLPDPSFFLDSHLPIIAADGAANTLDHLGLSPDLIIGDLDSVSHSIRSQNKVLFCPDQNSCDYQKSLSYMKANDLLPAIVVGITGGCLDHILNNINIFLETDSLLYAPPLIGLVLKNDFRFSLPINTKLSLLGMPFASISSQGLKWELNHAMLRFPGANSCFNRNQSQTVAIKVHEGAALLLLYQDPIKDAGINC